MLHEISNRNSYSETTFTRAAKLASPSIQPPPQQTKLGRPPAPHCNENVMEISFCRLSNLGISILRIDEENSFLKVVTIVTHHFVKTKRANILAHKDYTPNLVTKPCSLYLKGIIM